MKIFILFFYNARLPNQSGSVKKNLVNLRERIYHTVRTGLVMIEINEHHEPYFGAYLNLGVSQVPPYRLLPGGLLLTETNHHNI